jgi:hypothetical protein
MTTNTLPTVVTSAGLQPQNPNDLLAQLLSYVAATNPGYTANLPGSLIEDISSTDVGAMVLIDSARVEAVNSLTPYGANNFLLTQLGNMYGVAQGQTTNTSAYVVFTGTPGFPINPGFIVADSGHQYVVQTGGIVGASGTSAPIYVVANQTGSWAVPPNTITTVVTSVPSTITLKVTNTTAGTPSAAAQTVAQYRAQVIQAGQASATGMPTFLKTQLLGVAGVQPNLVAVRQVGSNWQVICGGGDPYQTAYAIYKGLFNINNLQGSALAVSGITNANPGVVTTNLAHGLATGQVITLSGVVGMTQINGQALTITVTSPTTFSTGINTTSYDTYTSGGQLSPHPRTVTVTINDFPDAYQIPFVNPPQQQVGMVATWNTTQTNLVLNSTVQQLATPPMISYLNSLSPGYPINILDLQSIFQAAVTSVIPAQYLSKLTFLVTINGVVVNPTAGTQLIYGDPESYFYASPTSISVIRG